MKERILKPHAPILCASVAKYILLCKLTAAVK